MLDFTILLEGWTLEGGKSRMPKTVQDFDGSLGDLVQLQELLDELVTEEQQELLVIGRGQGAERTVESLGPAS